jgi:nucleotidyltransferase substrate binding protein (TIGR01987 family)
LSYTRGYLNQGIIMEYQYEGVYFGNLIKARDLFESFRQDMKTERDKAGAVQAFEFCYELSWKTMKRILDVKGLETQSPKDTFREAALNQLIASPEPWFVFQLKRNLTVHTYRIETLNDVLSVFDQFSEELTALVHNLESLS